MRTKPASPIKACDYALRILSEQATKAIPLREAVLSGEDPEPVHDLRVSIRRARRAVQSFSVFLPQDAACLEQPLHDLFHLLGTVRDFDIALSLWGELNSGNGASAVAERLQGARKKAKAELAGELPNGVVDRLIQAATSGHSDAKLASVPIEAAAPDLLGRSFKRAKQAATRLTSISEAAEIHLLRRRAKRLRDEMGFLLPLYRAEAKPVVESLKKLQDLLGAHQDLVIAEELLSGLKGLSNDGEKAVAGARKEAVKRRDPLRRDILAHAEDFGGGDWKKLEKRMRNDRRTLWT